MLVFNKLPRYLSNVGQRWLFEVSGICTTVGICTSPFANGLHVPKKGQRWPALVPLATVGKWTYRWLVLPTSKHTTKKIKFLTQSPYNNNFFYFKARVLNGFGVTWKYGLESYLKDFKTQSIYWWSIVKYRVFLERIFRQICK